MSKEDKGASFGPGSREPSPEGLGPSGFDPARGEVVWLSAILKRCEELTVLEQGDDLDEALEALASVRGLIRSTLANGVPQFLASLSQ